MAEGSDAPGFKIFDGNAARVARLTELLMPYRGAPLILIHEGYRETHRGRITKTSLDRAYDERLVEGVTILIYSFEGEIYNDPLFYRDRNTEWNLNHAGNVEFHRQQGDEHGLVQFIRESTARWLPRWAPTTQ